MPPILERPKMSLNLLKMLKEISAGLIIASDKIMLFAVSYVHHKTVLLLSFRL